MNPGIPAELAAAYEKAHHRYKRRGNRKNCPTVAAFRPYHKIRDRGDDDEMYSEDSDMCQELE